jgi:hypothetical protein
MPTTRRRLARHSVPRVDAVSCFRWTTNGYSPHPFGADVPVYGNETEARSAWEIYRRDVWAASHRMEVPRTAKLYDGLTTIGRDVIWETFSYINGIDLDGALAGLEADRTAITRFERANPKGAYSIADFLAKWRSDLDAIESIARRLQADRDCGAYQQLGSAQRYASEDSTL